MSFGSFVNNNSNNEVKKVVKEYFNSGISSFQNGLYQEAYLFFEMDLKSNKHVATLFNISLCQIKANQVIDAIINLKQSLNLLDTFSKTNIERTRTIDTLAEIDASSDTYKNVMNKDLIELFPFLAKIRIQRVLFDSYIQNNQLDEAKKIAGGLNGNYENIIDKMKEIKGE